MATQKPTSRPALTVYKVEIKHFNTVIAEFRIKAASELYAKWIGRALVSEMVPHNQQTIIVNGHEE